MNRFFFIFLITASHCFIYGQKDTIAIKQEALALKNSSTDAYNLGQYEESQIINQKLLKLAASINDPELLHLGYRFLAYDFVVAGDTIKARQALETSLSYVTESVNRIDLADTYLLEASLNQSSNQPFEKVLNSYNKSLDVSASVKDSIGIATSYLNLIHACLEYEENDLAFNYLNISKPLIEKYLPNDIYYHNILLSKYYLRKKEYQKASYHVNYAENHESYNHINLVDKESIYKIKASIYFESGQFKKAYESLKIAQQAAEENQNQIHNVDLQKVANTFEIEQYKKDALVNKKNSDLQNQLLDSKNKVNTFLILLSALSFLIIAFLIYGFLNRKKLADQLTLKNSEYLEAKEESERLAASKSDFFNTVSHELRTPLYGVIGMSTLLLEDAKIPEKNKDNLKTLKFSADYLLTLVNDVLQLGKIDAKKIPLESSLINIKSLINSLLSTFEYSKNQNNNIFKLDIAPEVPDYFKGNSMILKQVLMNLVGNAVKFTENGVIQLSINLLSHYADKEAILNFSIKDNGPGIPINKQKEIFAEFTQLENPNSYFGTGLGLPIVSKLLQILGSKIELESEVGKGSVFNFKFPVQFIDKGNKEYLTDATPLLDDTIFNGKKILVVDDNTINQVVTSKILNKLKAECTIAGDGREAINIVKKQEFDLILMDVNMPVMDGFAATEEIRLSGYDMPVIALTAVEADDVRLKSVECGMNAFIIKPYDIVDFKRTIAVNLMQYQKR